MQFRITGFRRRPTLRIAACAVMLAWCVAPAAAATERFSYSDGPLEGQGVAGDWSGPWVTGPQSTPPVGTGPWQVESNKLAVNPVNPTIPFGFEQSDVQRNLASPLAGSSVYMSFLITPGDMGSIYDPNFFTDGSTGVVVGLADAAGSVGTNGPMITTFRFYGGFSGLYTNGFAISLGGVFSASNTNIGTWTQGQTYRLVGRLTYDAQGQQERWSVWIDPTSEANTPAGSVFKNLAYNQIGMTRLYQYVDNFKNVGQSAIDDLRIGSTWDSVTAPLSDPIVGDLDGDGFVGIADLNIVLSNWNQNVPPGNPLADPSGDNFVGIADLNVVLGNWNAGIPPAGSAEIPEPASMALLGLSGLGILSRSRRLA